MKFIRWLWSDPETMRPVGNAFDLTDQEAHEWFVRSINPGSPEDCYLLIFTKQGQPVGEISFHRLHRQSMTADFNLKIVHKERRKGYAKEAMLLFLDYFFNCLKGRVLIDDVALDNKAGQQTLLSFGFEHDPKVKDVFSLLMTRERYNTLYHRNKTPTKPD
jgi:RimJ/RimL family protein N-acetyltransferase